MNERAPKRGRKKSPNPKQVVAFVRLEQTEKEKMDLIAKSSHMTTSEYLRTVVKTAVAQEWSFKPNLTTTNTNA